MNDRWNGRIFRTVPVIFAPEIAGQTEKMGKRDIAFPAKSRWWQEQPFICGRNPVFRGKKVQGPYFFPDAVCGAHIARILKLQLPGAEKKLPWNILRIFF